MNLSHKAAPIKHLLMATLFAMSATVGQQALAATCTWTGATDNLWTTNGNWSGCTVPVTGDALVFPTPTALNPTNTNNIPFPLAIDILSLAIQAGGYSISPGAIGLQGNVNHTAGTNTLGAAGIWQQPLTLTHNYNVSSGSTLIMNTNLWLNAGSQIAVFNVDGTLTLIGNIDGTAANNSMVKNGSGALTVYGNNTVTGVATQINAGEVRLTGFLGGGNLDAVTVNSGGTLSLSTGGTAGAIVVANGGTLTLGNGGTGIGNSGNLTMNPGAVFAADIAGTPAVNYSNLHVIGTVNLNGATLNLSGVYTPVVGNTFTLIYNDGADPVTGTFAGLPEGASTTLHGVPMRISYVGGDGNDVVLTAITVAPAVAQAIPTLSEWGMALLSVVLGLGAIMAMRRKV